MYLMIHFEDLIVKVLFLTQPPQLGPPIGFESQEPKPLSIGGGQPFLQLAVSESPVVQTSHHHTVMILF